MPPVKSTPEPLAFDIVDKKNVKPWSLCSESEQAQVMEMVEWQERQSPPLSDARFVANSGYTQSTWSRLKRGIYTGNIGEAIAVFRRHIIRLAEARAAAKTKPHSKFYETVDFEELRQAIKAANAEAEVGGQDRLVCYVADFGCGKTTLANRICEEQNGVLVEATPSWKKSYFSACQSIGEAVGLRRQFRGANEAEQQLLHHLKMKPRTLVFEEIEYTGESLLNLWKLILNQTECVLVIFFISKFFHDIRRKGGEYADQLLRRADVIIASKITASLALKFLTEHWQPTDELRTAAARIAAAANKKGGMHLCAKVAAALAREFKAHPPTLGDVETAIEAYRERHQYSSTTGA